ncbi:LysR family transcriptional regulator [Acidisphaera sp. L21]|uniref:LysR family transcriptional regulator n=1 Tax=Acidisphaera sp. L21 TaxID=1641851 RepID=UPI00131DED23|nr:LysR family transcriptional regulator [Acidisphaera sp. L21]
MPRIDLSLRQLEAFTEIVGTGGFRTAASSLHISQPALSRTIHLAEEALGARLFDRGNQGAVLTAAGRQLLPIAQRILREFDTSRGELAEFLAGRTGRIGIAVLPSIGVSIMPKIIAGFLAEFPAVRITLQGLSAGPLQQAVIDGRVDYGFSVRPPAGLGLVFEPVLTDEFVFLCSKDDMLAQRTEVPWSVFSHCPFVATSQNSSIRTTTDAVFAQAEMAVEPLYECGNVSMTAAIVAAGLGVTAIPRLSLGLVDQTKLVTRKLVAQSVSRQLGIVSRPSSSLSNAAERLKSKLLSLSQGSTLPRAIRSKRLR